MKHEWQERKFSKITLTCCKRCGIVQNPRNVEKSCKGIVKVEPR